MQGAWPSGLRKFVTARGYYSLYFLRARLDEPIKIGITHDPASRLSALQNANWRQVSFDRLWWLPGQPIAARIEAALKLQYLPKHIRGEWYDIDPADAARFVEATIERLGTWGITQAKIEQRYAHWARQRCSPPEIVRPPSVQEPKPDRRRRSWRNASIAR
jgi:hypothetical protein